jgi:hypothetical protein
MVKVQKAWEELTGRAYTKKSNIDCSDDVVYSTIQAQFGRSEILEPLM